MRELILVVALLIMSGIVAVTTITEVWGVVLFISLIVGIIGLVVNKNPQLIKKILSR